MIRRPTACLLALALWCSPAQAQTAAPAQAAPLPSEEQLDTLLAAHAWRPLVAVLSAPMTSADLARALLWLRTNIQFGAGPVLGLLYARDLWAIGQNANANGKPIDPAKDPRIVAAEVTLYTYAIIQLAGAHCADQSAPAHRIQQLVQARQPTLDFLAHQPKDIRAKAVAAALSLEQRTATFRKDDDFVCRDSDAQSPAETASAPSAPGQAAEEQAEPPVKYADPAAASPREAQIRAALPLTLRRLAALQGPS